MKILKGNLVSAPALGKLEIVELFCFEDLQHDDEFVCHGTVINQIVLPHQGVALVGEDFIFFGHSGTSK